MNNPFKDESPPRLLTVSALNRQAKSLLESHFGFVWVEGEISNFASPSSGHWYFSLKDGNAQVRCAMFRNRNQRLRIPPGNGDAVKLRARVSLYEGRGEFQLIVEHLELSGEGALQVAFEKLKARLYEEGLFDLERKQALPQAVSSLGVITSPTGAALQDILTVLARRCPAIRVYVIPVAVQGQDAAPQIATAISQANRWQAAGKIKLDALVVGRGGGSLEDLWAFNEEIVARAISASKLVVISAVGHEIDFTIADLVADHRAPTPSAAAEMLSADQREWRQKLATVQDDLLRLIFTRLGDAEAELNYFRLRLQHPGAQLREQAQRTDDLEQRLQQAGKNLLLHYRSDLHLVASQLRARSPLPRVRQWQKDLQGNLQRLDLAVEQQLNQSRSRLAHLAQLLDSVSPLGVLRRGYAIVTDQRGQVIRDAGRVSIGQEVAATLERGRLGLTVSSVDPGE